MSFPVGVNALIGTIRLGPLKPSGTAQVGTGGGPVGPEYTRYPSAQASCSFEQKLVYK